MAEDQPAGQTPNPLEWLTIEQAAGWLQVSTKTIRRYIEAGSLPAVNLGGRAIRIRRQDLESWLQTRRIEPGVSLRRQERLERAEERRQRHALHDRLRDITPDRLSEVNLSIEQENPLVLRCNTCGATWSPKQRSNGKLVRQSWCCPNGCNCP